jgi:hypothetical protein
VPYAALPSWRPELVQFSSVLIPPISLLLSLISEHSTIVRLPIVLRAVVATNRKDIITSPSFKFLTSKHRASAALYLPEDSWYSFLLEDESSPASCCGWKTEVSDLDGTRTSELVALLQPTVLPRALSYRVTFRDSETTFLPPPPRPVTHLFVLSHIRAIFSLPSFPTQSNFLASFYIL